MKISKSGLTLIEVMIVLAIFSVILTAIYSVLTIGRSSYQSGDVKIAIQQETRKAMDKLVTELRAATSVNLTDEYPFTIGADKTKYTVVDGQLQKEIQGQPVIVMANDIGSIQFTLRGGDIVIITLVGSKNTRTGRQLSTTLISQVGLRN